MAGEFKSIEFKVLVPTVEVPLGVIDKPLMVTVPVSAELVNEILPALVLSAEEENAEVNPPFKATWVLVLAPLPVTEDKVEVSAMVMVPEPLPVVVISVPAVRVKVPPWEMVELEPEVDAAVKRDPPDTRQVEQVRVSVPPRATDPPPPKGEEVLTVKAPEFTKALLGILVMVFDPPEILAPVIAPALVITILGVFRKLV